MSTFPNTVSAFAAWQSMTREDRLTSPEKILNDAAKNTWLIGEMLRGKPQDIVARGGKYISERIKLSNQNNFANYTPGQERNPARVNTVQTINIPWRFAENNVPYTEAEIDLSAESDGFVVFKNFQNYLDQELETDHWEGLENSLWALPDQGNMEAGATASGAVTPGKPYSIPTFITEDGLVPPANNGTFTSIEGLSPSTHANWANQVSTYTPGDLANSETGIFAAFDRIMAMMMFEIPEGAKYYENDNMRALKIATNLDGLNRFQGLLRAANDHTRNGASDPSYSKPEFKGIPVKYVARLGDGTTGELLEQSPIGTYTGAVYPSGRPRYFFINTKFLFPVFHKKHMMKEIDPLSGGVRQRDAFTTYKESWYNLVCRSRRRQGIVRPAA